MASDLALLLIIGTLRERGKWCDGAERETSAPGCLTVCPIMWSRGTMETKKGAVSCDRPRGVNGPKRSPSFPHQIKTVAEACLFDHSFAGHHINKPSSPPVGWK